MPGLDGVCVGQPLRVRRPRQAPRSRRRRLRASSRTRSSSPERSTSSSRPSCTWKGGRRCRRRPGSAVSCSTRPPIEGGRTSGGASSARGSTGATVRVSSPVGVVHPHTARSSPSGSASRARTPGSASSVRAGPSRWVSRCTVPRTVDDARAARPVGRRARQPRRGRDAVRLRAVRGPPSRTSRRRRQHGTSAQRVEDPQLAGRLVDHPRAVRGRVPHVERGAPGPPWSVCRRRSPPCGHRVEVAPALVVGQEREPLADLHRRLELRVDPGEQPDELPGAVGVPPQLAAVPPR